MRGFIAAESEVRGRGHDAFAKVMLPDPIYHYSRGEWITWTGQPAAELKPATGSVRNPQFPNFAQELGNTAPDRRSLLCRFSTRLEARIHGLRVRDTVSARQGRRQAGAFQFPQFIAERCELFFQVRVRLI